MPTVGSDQPQGLAHVDAHRRRASYLYGLIVSGAVLAAAPESLRIGRIIAALLATLVIYWASETYVHWIATRQVLERDLTSAERRQLVLDGWPLVTACAVPALLLMIESVLGVETSVAVDVALLANTGLLVVVGYRMSRAGGLRGGRLLLSAGAAGVLGVGVIALKTLLH
jgi:hypothetical protein